MPIIRISQLNLRAMSTPSVSDSPAPATKTKPVEEIPDAIDDLEAPPSDQTETTALVKAHPVKEARASTTRLQDIVKFIDRAPKTTGMSSYRPMDTQVVISTPEVGILRFTVFSSADNVDCGFIRFDGDAQTDGDGFVGSDRLILDRDPFTRLIRDLPVGRVARFRHKKDTLRVDCENSTYRFATRDESTTAIPSDEKVTVLGDETRQKGFFDLKATKNTFWFVHSHLSNDSLRPAMTCAVTDEHKGKDVLVGTDGHGLSLCPLRGSFPTGMMIPQVAFQAVRGMHGDAVTIRQSPEDDATRYTFECGNERFSWSEPGESFPNWRNVVPDNEAGEWSIYSPDEMLSAVERIKPHCPDMTNHVIVELPRHGNPRLVADATESDVSDEDGIEELPFTEYDGPGCAVGLNTKYLHRVVKSMKKPPVVFDHSEPKGDGTLNRALTAHDRSGRHALIMPVMIDW